MFNAVTQTLTINAIDFNNLNLHKIGKHTYVIKSPRKTIPQGVVFKFQRGRIPRPGDVVHVTILQDDTSRVAFDRQVVAIQTKNANYTLRMSCPPELRLSMGDDGYVTGCAIHVDADGEHVKVNQHSLSW